MSEVYNNHDFERNDEYCYLISVMHTHDLSRHVDDLKQHVDNYRKSLETIEKPKQEDIPHGYKTRS